MVAWLCSAGRWREEKSCRFAACFISRDPPWRGWSLKGRKANVAVGRPAGHDWCSAGDSESNKRVSEVGRRSIGRVPGCPWALHLLASSSPLFQPARRQAQEGGASTRDFQRPIIVLLRRHSSFSWPGIGCTRDSIQTMPSPRVSHSQLHPPEVAPVVQAANSSPLHSYRISRLKKRRLPHPSKGNLSCCATWPLRPKKYDHLGNILASSTRLAMSDLARVDVGALTIIPWFREVQRVTRQDNGRVGKTDSRGESSYFTILYSAALSLVPV